MAFTAKGLEFQNSRKELLSYATVKFTKRADVNPSRTKIFIFAWNVLPYRFCKQVTSCIISKASRAPWVIVSLSSVCLYTLTYREHSLFYYYIHIFTPDCAFQ